MVERLPYKRLMLGSTPAASTNQQMQESDSFRSVTLTSPSPVSDLRSTIKKSTSTLSALLNKGCFKTSGLKLRL